MAAAAGPSESLQPPVAVDGMVSMSPLKKTVEADEHTPIRIGQVISTDLVFNVGDGRTVTLHDVPVYVSHFILNFYRF